MVTIMTLSVTVPAADTRAWYAVHVPGRDAQWIIGTVVAAVIALSVQMGGIRNDLAEVRADIREIRTDMRRMDDRLRAVEITLGKVEQRLLTLERIILPSTEQPGE